MRLIEYLNYLKHKPRIAFVIAILLLAMLTVVSTYVLYYRFSIYEESGGWGRTLDRGFPEFEILAFYVMTYFPALLLVLFPRSWYWESILSATIIFYLIFVIVVEFILTNIDLNKNSEDVYAFSMLGRLAISFIFVGFLLIISGSKLLKKLLTSMKNKN